MHSQLLHFHQSFVDFTDTIHHDTYPAISNTNHKGHAVVVAGASRGIGRGIAISFAKAGASAIAIIGRSHLDDLEAEMLQAASAAGHEKPNILKLRVDITNEDAVKEGAAQVKSSFGRLDILINNAGRLEPLKPILESETSEWWHTFEVNLKGTYLVTKSFLGLLLEGGLKTIITCSSTGSLMRTYGMSGYQTTKSALLRFTDLVMREYGDQGLVAFCIHPGTVMTKLIDVLPESEHGIFVDDPRLCGDTVAWLSEERREWMAGRLISVNWDMQELDACKEEIIQEDKLKMKMVF